jgi:hypothetical protein
MFFPERLFVRLIKGSLAGWIKIVSSRCPSLQAGTISSSAITRSGRFSQPFGDWVSIPVRLTEFSDLTRTARSKITSSRNKLPVTGQPDQGLNTLLGIF